MLLLENGIRSIGSSEGETDMFSDIDREKLLELYYNDVPFKTMASELGISYYKCRGAIRVAKIIENKSPISMGSDTPEIQLC